MTWKLSRFLAGDLVEVRGREEILATLDAEGCMDGMPFMPEMLQFCGRRIRVGAVAHKTCEVARQTLKARRLDTTVHLAGTYCDGSAHGGCQADCNLFWKDSWLKPAEDDAAPSAPRMEAVPRAQTAGSSEAGLLGHTRLQSESEQLEPAYSCQATKLFDATKPLAWWDPRQYLRDVITRNHPLGHVVGVLLVSFLKHLHLRSPRGYRLTKELYESTHRRLLGRELPTYRGRIAPNQPTPTGRLGLAPGDHVRIKSKEAIEATLDGAGRNRGMYFGEELVPYCGTVRTVRKSVTQILDEATGRMRYMKQPCIMLEGVVCKGDYSECRLLCPRAIPSYWREIWLERVEDDQPVSLDRRSAESQPLDS